MSVVRLDNRVIVSWQGYSYWFDTMAEAEAFMRNVEDAFLYI